MSKKPIISAAEAAALVKDGDIITTSGGDIGDTPAIDVTNIGA